MIVHSATFGPYDRALGWVPSPTHIMRRLAIRRLFPFESGPKRVLEFGCGAGTLLAELGQLGFSGRGLDTSAAARTVATAMTAQSPQIEIGETVPESERGTYDLLIACEVLEHIEQDRAALSDWVGWLKPGGQVLLTVPAHARRFGASDQWAGHVRRYEKADLAALMAEAGLTLDRLVCTGFPVTNLLEPLSNHLGRKKMAARAKATNAAATASSGVERTAEMKAWPLYSNPLGVAVFRLADLMQAAAFNSDLGTGLVALGRKGP
jgi:SAM-dependent methyltransferase